MEVVEHEPAGLIRCSFTSPVIPSKGGGSSTWSGISDSPFEKSMSASPWIGKPSSFLPNFPTSGSAPSSLPLGLTFQSSLDSSSLMLPAITVTFALLVIVRFFGSTMIFVAAAALAPPPRFRSSRRRR